MESTRSAEEKAGEFMGKVRCGAGDLLIRETHSQPAAESFTPRKFFRTESRERVMSDLGGDEGVPWTPPA